MNQKEWIDLFQSVNGRGPTQEELAAAVKAGVIADAHLAQQKNAQPVFSRQPVNETTQKGANQFGKEQASPVDKASEATQAKRSGFRPSRPRPAQPTSPEPLIPNAKKAKSKKEAVNPASQAVRRASFGGVHQAPSRPQAEAQKDSQKTVTQVPSQAQTTQSAQVEASQKPQAAINPVFSQPQPKKKKAKWPKILLALVALITLALAGWGGYAWKRNESGNIEGTWQLTHWEYRNTNSDNGEWVDALQRYKNQGYAYYDFITVKNKHYQENSYTYDKKDASKPYLSLWSYLDDIYTVNQWDKKIEIHYSTSEYKKKVSQVLKTDLKGYYSYLKTADVDKDIKKTMVSYHYSRSYEVKGDKLIVIIKDDNGQTISKSIYKKLSPSKAKSLKEQFNAAKKKFEKNYHIK